MIAYHQFFLQHIPNVLQRYGLSEKKIFAQLVFDLNGKIVRGAEVVDITSDYKEGKIFVNNMIQPKMDNSAGSGIGLANLSERYRLKWNTDIEILNNNVEFCVVIKLKEIDK